MVATSITINIVTSTINVATTVPTSINKRLCQHADDKSLIESTWSQQWCGLKDDILHLQLPIVYLIWGLLRHCWMLRRCLEAEDDCWRGPQYDGKCSFYFKCYFFRTTPTNWDLREKAVYFPPQVPSVASLIFLLALILSRCCGVVLGSEIRSAQHTHVCTLPVSMQD